jgi:hypothetical protein
VVFLIIRKPLTGMLEAFARQISSGARLKYGELEFTGVNVVDQTVEVLKGNSVLKDPASKELYEERSGEYEKSCDIFLVHKIRHSSARGRRDSSGRRFDIELSLISHKGRGRLTDVDVVEYYFGQYFGDAPYGSVYKVSDPNGGFAVVTSAYGEFLCLAKVHFRNGKVVSLERYIDFAMSPVLPPVREEKDDKN